ncbi:hypothetical protein [Streptomyces sp. NPDC101165]|uniref:hypothetical protein n=1 Tax=Streptomyces sp. NPDC101165 TaxID=3366119 RepID=UPI003813D2A0
MLVTKGRGKYSVDSACIPCSAGTLLWTRPNQVIQAFPDDMEGELLMFTEAFPLPMHAGSGCWTMCCAPATGSSPTPNCPCYNRA